MMIFKKAIPRRTFLRGIGTTLALPLLDGMIPAMAALRETDAKPKSCLSIVYIPNGRIMEQWTPKSEGASFDLPPILEPLTPFRDRLLVLSGLCNNNANELPGESVQGGQHERAGGTFLTGVHPKYTDGANVRAGTSVDQIIAKELGKHTQLASLEIGLDFTGIVGACENGWSCSYVNTISWRTPTTPLHMENNPRAVFERLVGDLDSTDRAEQLARVQMKRSILDSVIQAASQLMTDLGPGDRAKVTEYLDAIRDTERRIQMAEEQSSRELPLLERPGGIPATYEEHAKLMFDLQVLAFQSDLTRVITFMMGREKTDRPYPEIGIPDSHHPLSHHNNDPEKVGKVARINIFQSKLFAYYLAKLQSTPDGDGSLLDHLMVLYASSISNGNGHSYVNLPVLLAGGGAGQLKGGRHLRYAKDTPVTNLFVTLLDKFGLPVEQFGDSTGALNLLSV